MFKFIHIPVQSGNDKILKSMKRKYTVEDFKEIVKRFRDNIPNITIATDMRVGFPGETETQFNDSLALIRTITPDVLHRSKFCKRPKTKAAQMENQIPVLENKK